MGHYVKSTVARCVDIEHVQKDRPCTWLRVSDVNDAVGIHLHGPAIRVLAMALGHHAADLDTVIKRGQALPQDYRDLEITRDLARWMGIDDYSSIQTSRHAYTDDPITKE